MRKSFRQISAVLLLLVVTSIYLNGTRVLGPTNTLSSYLSDLRYSGPEGVWNRALFGGRERWGSMEGYLRLTAEYDHRKNYGLMDGAGEAHYHREFSRMASNALREWQGYHAGAFRKELINEAKDVVEWEKLKKNRSPAMVVGVVAAAYSGKMIRYRVSPRMALETRTMMQGSTLARAYLGWSSQALGASAGSTYDSENGGNVMLSVRKEIATGVSVNYDKAEDHAVGVSYSAGF